MNADEITLIDLCYRYGASPAAQTLVDVPLLSTKRFPTNIFEAAADSRVNLIELMRFQRVDTSDIQYEPRTSEFWLWHERLNFYSLLLVAQFTHAIPQDLPESFIELAKEELGYFPLGQYGESGFPLAGAFLLKLEGRYEDVAYAKASDIFRRLLAFDASVRTDPSMLRSYWLASLPSHGWFLNNYLYYEAGGESFVNVLDYVLKTVDRQDNNATKLFVEALWNVLHFCNDLHELLSGIEDRTVACLVRHYYSHILDVFHDQRTSPLKFHARAISKMFKDLVDRERSGTGGVEKEQSAFDVLYDAFFSVTNREQWPFPSNLEVLLTDQQPQFTQ